MFTFSKWDRVHMCIGSAVLPEDPIAPNEDADAGNARHDFLFEVGQDGDVDRAAALQAEEHRAGLRSLNLDKLPIGKPWVQELAMAIDVRTGITTPLGVNIKRAYPVLTPWHVMGTTDSMLHGDRVAHVWDFKGWWSKVTPSADVNRQVRAQMIGAVSLGFNGGEEAWEDGPDGYAAEGGLIHLDDEGDHEFDGPVKLDVMELGASLDELRHDVQRTHDAHALVQIGRMPPVVEGPWCAYCPSIMHCPAKAELHRQLAPVTAALHPVQATIMSRIREDPNGARAWAASAGKLVDEVKSQIAIHALAVGGFPTTGGKRYGKHEEIKQQPDGNLLWITVLDLWGEEAARCAVEMKGTRTGVERAAKWAVDRQLVQTIAEGKRIIERMLKATAGGWIVKKTQTVGEYDPAKEEAKKAKEEEEAAKEEAARVALAKELNDEEGY